jgi:hypothetical protein
MKKFLSSILRRFDCTDFLLQRGYHVVMDGYDAIAREHKFFA